MARKGLWQRNWIEAVSTSDWKRSGGQGTLKLVNRVDDPNGSIFVLKELKSQKDPERRARMRREVVVLETMPHSSTPSVVDHNTDAYEDFSIELFAVFEYITGPTLSEHIVSQGPVSVSDAVVLTVKLLDILKTYHDAGSGHRDIKPDNLILRNGNFAYPVLIDFGLTFNVLELPDDLTPSWQQIGNRFLALPEHAATSDNKRDLRSDITFCVGILFFALTGIQPSTIVDESNKTPHQRLRPREILDGINGGERLRLLQIFDQGFAANLAYRWQTIAAFRAQLERILQADMTEDPTEESIRILRERAAAKSGNQQVIDALDRVRQRIEDATLNAVFRLGQGYAPSMERRLTNLKNMDTWIRCGVEHVYEGRRTDTPFLISAIGDEVVVEELFTGSREIRARVPIHDPEGMPNLHDEVVRIIIANVSRNV